MRTPSIAVSFPVSAGRARHRAVATSPLLAMLTATLAAQVDPGLLAGLEARSIGPAGMSGRVAVVTCTPADPSVVWVGAATGGLWQSTDGGVTFAPRFDDQPVAAIGAIAIHERRTDHVWVGTGEGNPRNSASIGDGVYRSIDGGRTWSHVGLADSERVHRIVLHPENPDVAWVAALGRTWGENAERGVFKTTDGGRTWRRVLFVDERTGCCDLVADPTNPDKLIAAMWQHRRWPDFFESGGPGSGIHVSHDGGETWTRRDHHDGLPAGDLGRIGVAIAASDPRVVYALVEGKPSSLLRSDDGGRRWRVVNREPDVAPRPFYYADIRVDPERPDRVYNLHSEITVSDDGGRSFTKLVPFERAHPDHHSMWIDPSDARHIWIGNDGGVYESRDRGATWRFVENLPLAQFYHVRFDFDSPYHVYGGLQDNGSWRGPSSVWENGGIRNHHWEEVGFGDGFDTSADPLDSMQGWSMSQAGYLMRWDLRTGERRDVRPPAPDGVELRFNWNAGFAQDPHDAATIYYGSQFVHRSTDRGRTWEIVSPDLTTDDSSRQRQRDSGGLTLDVTGAENFTTIVAIAPSPVAAGTLWVGTDDGRLHVTTDAGRTWQSVEGNVPGVPRGTWIPHVEPDRFAEGGAFVVFDDHRRSNFDSWVYATRDHGATWRSLATGDLRGYCLSIVQDPLDPELLFCGTEFGLWASLDGGGSWLPFRHGIPTVSCMDLAVHPRDGDLIVATHGRGLYVVDDVQALRELDDSIVKSPLHLFDPPVAQQYRVKQTGASRFPGQGEWRGENRPYGAMFTLWLGDERLPLPDDDDEAARARANPAAADATAPKPPRLELTIVAGDGSEVCRFDEEAHRGIQRVVWNLASASFRRPPARDDEPEKRPSGPQVAPGDYELRATLGDATASARFTVLGDPRIATTPAGHAANQAALREVRALNDALVGAIERVRDTRSDVGVIAGKRRKAFERAADADADALIAQSKELVTLLDALERRLWNPPEVAGIPARDHPLGRVGTLRRSLESTWDEPSPTQRDYLRQATDASRAILAEVDALFAGAVAAFRSSADAAGVRLLLDR